MNESKYAYHPTSQPFYHANSEVIHTGLQIQKVTLGPIIGKVTDIAARVLVEYAQDGVELLTLIAPNGLEHHCQRQVRANRPVAFEFQNLTPRTLYKVHSNHPFQCSSAFRTMSQGAAPTNFAFVSCNSRMSMEKYKDSNNLWGDLANRALTGQIDYIIHFGDQVYVDFYNKIYDKCVDMIKKTPKHEWNNIAGPVQEMLRVEYRLTWGSRLEATALANCPNIMQFDDHEIRDDLGFRPEDIDPNTPDGFYIQQARVVYYEYQRQLREDIDFTDLDKIKTEFHSHIINNVGIFIVDYRGKNSWLRAPEKGQLGKLQWQALEQALDPINGDFRNCNMFILVSPLPLVLYSHRWTRAISKFIDDASEEWEYESQQEHVALLSLMENWKKAGNGAREVFLMGGDIHHGGHTDVKRAGKVVYNQMVTSGICQERLGHFGMIMSRFVMSASHKIYADWTFRHHGWTQRNNYGIISLTDPLTNSFTAGLVTSGVHSKIKIEKVIHYNYKGDGKQKKEHKKAACSKFF